MASQSDLNKQASDLRAEAARTTESKQQLRDAMNALTQAHADVKTAVENGHPCDWSAFTAAVDNVTAAVSKVTDHGGPSPITKTVESPDAPVAKK
jgi:hypothetical protein